MSTIYTRAFIARKVEEARRDDMHDGTDLALQRVAALVNMTPQQVAQIAQHEADPREALEQCEGCGACVCGRAEVEA